MEVVDARRSEGAALDRARRLAAVRSIARKGADRGREGEKGGKGGGRRGDGNGEVVVVRQARFRNFEADRVEGSGRRGRRSGRPRPVVWRAMLPRDRTHLTASKDIDAYHHTAWCRAAGDLRKKRDRRGMSAWT